MGARNDSPGAGPAAGAAANVFIHRFTTIIIVQRRWCLHSDTMRQGEGHCQGCTATRRPANCYEPLRTTHLGPIALYAQVLPFQFSCHFV